MSSNRVKRLLRKIENLRGSKKKRISRSEDEAGKEGSSNIWTPKSLGDFPINNIYNSSSRSPPAELFRKDLISAMKLPDSEPLAPDDYWLISDQWKQEWERGVQVPVNPDALPEPSVRVVRKKDKAADFKMPKKLIRMSHDESFSADIHQISDSVALVEKVCRYDLDDCDLHWLTLANSQRAQMDLPTIEEDTVETIMETMEMQCYESVQEAIHSEAVLGIEYDENVICDVCRSPDSEEGNEMVFCDACDICVHQACYGITSIPEGSWLCRTCSLAIKPSCILCPNKGGAMKSTWSGNKWAHVSCALWIPEVSIGCVEKMEPITKIAHIPPSRWALICCLCRERAGACIQCSVKSCKTAYHVTCGFQKGLLMKAIVEDENDEDGVKLRSYCPKHSKNKELSSFSDSEGEDETSSVSGKEISSEDKANARAKRLRQIETLFFKYVKVSEVAEITGFPSEVVEFVYHYWKQKRRTGFNVPLLIPRSGESDALSQVQEDGLYARMKMFVHLRQDLERVRNLCYMVSRREKLSRSWTRMREQIFHQQVSVVTDESVQLTDEEKRSVVHACHGRNVYDRLYAHDRDCCPTVGDGGQVPTDANGLVKGQRRQRNPGEKLPNPYAKTYYFNGMHGRARRKSGNCLSDQSEGDVKVPKIISDGISCLSDTERKWQEAEVVEEVACRPVGTEGGADDATIPVHAAADVKVEPVDEMEHVGVAAASASVDDETHAQPHQCTEQQHFTRSSSHKSAETVSCAGVSRVKYELVETRLAEHLPHRNDVGHTSSSRSERSATAQPYAFDSPKPSCGDSPKDESKDGSAKENVEALDVAAEVANKLERRNEDGGEAEAGCGATRSNRHRSSRQRFRNLRSPPKEGVGKSLVASHVSTVTDSPPIRDKHRQETAKIHESLFANNSLKGTLAGYRIPKKTRTESESEAKLEEVAAAAAVAAERPSAPPLQQQQQPLPQVSPPLLQPTAEVRPPTTRQQHQLMHPADPRTCNNGPSWREQGAAPPAIVNNNVGGGGAPPPFMPQQPTWNCNPRQMPLLPTPAMPLLPLPDRRLTRRDRMVSSSSSSSRPPFHPPQLPSQMNGGDGGHAAGRIVLKFRKDPNFPESQRWRTSVRDPGIYDFRCESSESSESPPSQIVLAVNTRYDKHHGGGHERGMHPADPRTCNKRNNGSKYSMRSRTPIMEPDYGAGIS